jgi:hypothetical protein
MSPPCAPLLLSCLPFSSTAIPMNTSLVPNRLLARDAVDIGRLVLDINSPEQDYFDPKFAIDSDTIIVRQQVNFSEILQHTSGSKLHGFLTTAFGASYFKRNEKKLLVNSPRNMTYQLKNSSNIFERMCEIDLTKKWIEKAIGRGRSVYMVVGIQTLLDAQLSELDVKETGRTFDATLPVDSVASAAAGVPISLTNLFDTGAGGLWNHKWGTLANFIAPGEQVYAVQYRKVNFSWYSSKKVENSALQKGNRWKVYWLRSGGVEDEVDDEDNEDIVEAQLKETLSISDLNLGTSYERFEIDDKEVILFATG